jgi:hypothetical protein
MTRSSLSAVALSLLLGSGCWQAAANQRTVGAASTGEASSIPVMAPHFVPFGDSGYLLDPLSQSCTLVRFFYGGPVAVPVDCATLAANNRDLATRITWVRPGTAPAVATPPAAPTAPATPPAATPPSAP